ncbi:dnaJ homolog subfamily C member 22 [Maniola jurtina]|uniref:dnaJ homolog subfamily C member 22 n=1 Tax=Maniola jurtina TaxID=191418 RepID=UPI001E686226|nr:dnaJ homolog subfamily C member 22 [Maniola jurtina]XP_045784947.1 dnaJ homolog subfamily C member 22 [Maniola jurtina]
MSAQGGNMQGKKSVFRAYVLWIVGGIYGLHHFYLGRDFQAFVWWSTLGGFGGWLADVVNLPRYVRDANEEPGHMQALVKKMRQCKKPPFSVNRFTGMLAVGYTWGCLMQSAVPNDEVWGINFKFLNLLVPLAATLGVWAVGNIGREQGSLKWPLLAAYATYPIRYYYYDKSVWITLMVLASSLVFDSYAKEWRRTPPKRRHVVKRLAVLAMCASLYLALWGSSLYFNDTFTDADGVRIPVFEALQQLVYGEWWADVQQFLVDLYQFAQHHGWYEVWKQVVELCDPEDEQNAYKVLGVSPDASQQEITRRWRRLSRENHPDKAKLEDRRAAQEKFMEIQQAYEILSVGKHRRFSRNKKDNSVPDGPIHA